MTALKRISLIFRKKNEAFINDVKFYFNTEGYILDINKNDKIKINGKKMKVIDIEFEINVNSINKIYILDNENKNM
jgi:hypothetical protein